MPKLVTAPGGCEVIRDRVGLTLLVVRPVKALAHPAHNKSPRRSSNVQTAAHQAAAAGCVLFGFNHQLLLTLGWLKPAAAGHSGRCSPPVFQQIGSCVSKYERRWGRETRNTAQSSSVNVRRSALSSACLLQHVGVSRVHMTVFTLCSQTSLTLCFFYSVGSFLLTNKAMHFYSAPPFCRADFILHQPLQPFNYCVMAGLNQ